MFPNVFLPLHHICFVPVLLLFLPPNEGGKEENFTHKHTPKQFYYSVQCAVKFLLLLFFKLYYLTEIWWEIFKNQGPFAEQLFSCLHLTFLLKQIYYRWVQQISILPFLKVGKFQIINDKTGGLPLTLWAPWSPLILGLICFSDPFIQYLPKRAKFSCEVKKKEEKIRTSHCREGEKAKVWHSFQNPEVNRNDRSWPLPTNTELRSDSSRRTPLTQTGPHAKQWLPSATWF